ncbi:MAG: AAA family ATPase, partial [Verrucomicrobiia bacterium]
MLTTLRIRNLALVTDLTLELPPGFIAITGETGAGKSIIIGALNLLLGERADRTLIRSGEEACSVEAVFDLGPAENRIRVILDSYGIEPAGSGQLLLKRTFTVAGANRQYVNGSPTTLQALAAIGEWLVDVHGPHDHQSQLHPNRQLAILDAFGNHGNHLDACADAVRKLAKIRTEKAALVMDEQEHARQLDLLRFQVR